MRAATKEFRPVATCAANLAAGIVRSSLVVVRSQLWVWTFCVVVLMPSRAADGDLDPTFGRNGTAALPYFSASIRFYPALAMALQSDGKIVVAGSTDAPGSRGDFQVVRHNGDGSFDPAFGIEGTATADLGGDDAIGAIALQADGKIVAAGWTNSPGGSAISGYDIGVARFNRDGTLDNTFGNGGKIITNLAGGNSAAQAVVVQPDSKIVVAGFVSAGIAGEDFLVVRYLRDGSLDRTFGVEGKITTGIPWARAFALALQPDGKIVVAGMTQHGGGSTRIALARYDIDGIRDATFGAGGLAFGPLNVWNAAFAMALQPDGKIVVAGSEGEWSALLSLYRFNTDGSLDPTFSPPDPRSAPGAASLALQADGKIVVSTRFHDIYDTSAARARAVGNISLARYNSDGSLDTTFATGGYVFGTGGADAVTVLPDGRIVAVSRSAELVRYDNPSLTDFIVLRRTVPTILAQPIPQRITSGSTVVFAVAASGGFEPSYQWSRDDTVLPGATRATLVLPNATPADAGTYAVVIVNAAGRVTSAAATLEIVPSAEPGRLVNFSILTTLAEGETMTLGTVLGGAGTSGSKPLLARAAGPALSQFGVNGGLSNPMLIVSETSAGARLVATNNGWGGTPALVTAFAQVGAFSYSSPTSKDAAILHRGTASLAAGSYTVQVKDVANAGGVVMAELYDATPASSFSGTTPRLINVSVLKEIETAAPLTAGFTIGGSTGKTLLVRAVGPSLGLAPFNLARAMPAPMMTLVNAATGTTLASNRDWDGDAQIAQTADRVGAFAGSTATRDAVLLVTLAPGIYTVQVRPSPSTNGGVVMMDVYEVP